MKTCVTGNPSSKRFRLTGVPARLLKYVIVTKNKKKVIEMQRSLCVALQIKTFDVSLHHVLIRTPSLPTGGDPFLKAAVIVSNQSFGNPNGNI